MTISIRMPWPFRRSYPPQDRRQARLQRVFDSAVAQTRYARDYAKDDFRLEALPKIDLLAFLRHAERYTVERAKPVRARLHYPLGEAPRTAVVGREVEESRRVRTFARLQSPELAAFAPHALAAPLDALRSAASEAPVHAPLRNALLVFTGILQGPLTTEDTDRLWRRYQVPVFEQFLGFGGELLAWECEIHHGLHVREAAAHFECDEDGRLAVSFLANPRLPVLRLETGLSGRLIADTCPCGDPSPRLADLRRRSVRNAAPAPAVAAAAVS